MYNNKKILAVIPARSGSKAIKNKNIKKLNGKPLISYSIKYALDCKYIDEIIVSTDSKKYANIAKKYRVKVPFLRSKKLSDDYVQDYPVILDALKKSEKIFKIFFDYIVLLRPTSPYREFNLIGKAIKKIHNNKSCSSIRSVYLSNAHPYRHWKLKKNGKFIEGFVKKVKEPFSIPRQKLPKLYFQSGDLEIIKRKTLLDGSICGKKVMPLILKRKSIDIDRIEDFKFINKYYGS